VLLSAGNASIIILVEELAVRGSEDCICRRIISGEDKVSVRAQFKKMGPHG